jgi:hypothetical protein
MKKILILFMLVFSTVFIYSQSAKVETYGVDPRQAEEDSTDIFPFAYNGLANVGQQTLMYLKVQLDGQMITSPTWNVIDQPAGSNPVFGDSENLNDSTQVIQFTPDIEGLYKITYTDGAVTSDTLTITAGLYLGYASTPVGCNTCHADKVTEWEQTGHYMIFEEGLNGTLSDHYGPSCIKCHTTGYDVNADNQGFDDWPFIFPDTLYPGQFDNMVDLYPEAMARGRIQCESCHGPGSQHYGNVEFISVTLDAQNCAWCHDEGTHHVFPAQWRASDHATFARTGGGGETRASCAQCHDGAGFVDYIKSGKQPLTTDYSEVTKISCAVCHDPHSVENPHQLRTMTATLSNGEEVTGAGNGTICMNCHKARRDAVDYTDNYLGNLSSHYGPHHGPQADMLLATNAITFGQDIPTSPHFQETGDACVTCHMYPASSDADGNVILVGSHSFRMSEEGVDNVAACSPCHGDIGTSFADKKYYINGNADLDGNGTADGLQIEIQGLLDQLKSHLPQNADGEVSITDSSVTLTEAQAAYNYFMIEDDGSFGIHNPAFTFGLLKASIEALGGFVAVDYDRSNLPNDFELSQNYPNPFNPTTSIQYQLPEGSNVKVVVYDALGKQVAVLVNGYQNAGTYTTNFNASNLASGIYFYRMEAGNFVKVNKMLLLK